MNGQRNKNRSGRRQNFLSRMSTTGVVALVALSTVGVLIVTPRPTAPHVIPLPEIDPAAGEALEREQRLRAERVHQKPLERAARIVGEQVRRVGLQLARKNSTDTGSLVELRKDTRALLEQKREALLLDLRALQAELFLQAVHRFERSRHPDQDLLELGGAFLGVTQESWLDDEGRLVHDDNTLRLFFRVHWGKLTGLFGHPSFGPSLQELKRYYSAQLRFPHAERHDVVGRALARLQLARALGKVDSTYPLRLAEGIFLLQAQKPQAAAAALGSFLHKKRDGAWVAVARNHLRYAELMAHSPSVGP